MRIHLPAALSALLALSGTALAQDATVEGPGYKVSEGTVLHPSVGVEAGVINNVFFEQDDPVTAPVVRLLADFDYATRGNDRLGAGPRAPQKVRFRAGARFIYSEFLTDNDAARDQRNLAIGADADLELFPESTFTLRVQDSFLRNNRPVNFESSQTLNRDVNRFRIEAGTQPGGRALYFGARYENVIDFFESEGSRFANRIQHTLGLRADWRFLPVTKFFFDGTYGYYDGLGDEAQAYKNSSTPLRLRVGALTALTERTTLRAHAGFAKGFYEAGPDYTGALFGVELGYRYSVLGRLSALYEHDYNDSINANFFSDHVFKLGFDQTLRSVLARASAEARLRTYQGVPMLINPTTTEREDLIFAARAEARYYFRDTLAVTADYAFILDETDFRSMVGEQIDDPSYVRHEVFLGARAAF